MSYYAVHLRAILLKILQSGRKGRQLKPKMLPPVGRQHRADHSVLILPACKRNAQCKRIKFGAAVVLEKGIQ